MPPAERPLVTPLDAGALAFGLLLGLALPLAGPWLASGVPEAQLPASYVGVLADDAGRTGLVVSARRLGRQLDVQQPVPLVLPAHHTLYLWTIGPSGAARHVGPLPAGASGRLVLPVDVGTLLGTAVELAVTVERSDAPPRVPGGAFVFRGACGRLWAVRSPSLPA